MSQHEHWKHRPPMDTTGASVPPHTITAGRGLTDTPGESRMKEWRMSSTVQFLTPEQIEDRRSALLSEAGIGVDDLRVRRQRGLLDIETQGLLDELENLEYLSGE